MFYNNVLQDYYGAPTRTRTADLLIKNQLAYGLDTGFTANTAFNNFLET